MDWFSLGDVSWTAVAIATLAQFAIGYVWYQPGVLGRARIKQVAFRSRGGEHPGGMGGTGRGAGGSLLRHGVAGVVVFLTALVMNLLMAGLGVVSVGGGALFGLVVGAVFRLGTHVVHNGFGLRGQRLSVIDGAHDVVALAVVGAIIGAFL